MRRIVQYEDASGCDTCEEHNMSDSNTVEYSYESQLPHMFRIVRSDPHCRSHAGELLTKERLWNIVIDCMNHMKADIYHSHTPAAVQEYSLEAMAWNEVCEYTHPRSPYSG